MSDQCCLQAILVLAEVDPISGSYLPIIKKRKTLKLLDTVLADLLIM